MVSHSKRWHLQKRPAGTKTWPYFEIRYKTSFFVQSRRRWCILLIPRRGPGNVGEQLAWVSVVVASKHYLGQA
jgi:hypothetical protein